MAQTCSLPHFQTEFKVVVIGAGNVGATATYAMLMDGTPSELVLFDLNREKAEGIVLDMEHSMAFLNHTRVKGTDEIVDCAGAHLIVVTAGARQQEGQTRLDLIAKNRAIFEDLIPRLVKVAPDALFLIVTNPVDVLTYEAHRLAGLPWGRVFGTGTLLDTARLRFHLGERLCVSPKSIHAMILGEHGDSSFPVWSSANIAGRALNSFPEMTEEVRTVAAQEVRTAAYRIIHDVGFTCYSIGTVIREIMVHIFQHSRVVLPLSVPVESSFYGLSGVALSVPCVLDSTGVSSIVEVPLSSLEQEQLQASAGVLRSLQRS
jgi:L-lactate dehydrogenase